MIRALLMMISLFFLFFLLLKNKDLVIAIQYYPGGSANSVPFYLLILGTFLFGVLLSVVMIFPGWLKLKLMSRRQKKEIESLVEEIGQLRTGIFSPGSSTPPSSPPRTDSQKPL